MAVVKYWVAICLSNEESTLRAKTKRELTEKLRTFGYGPDAEPMFKGSGWLGHLSKPRQTEVEYKDALDLINMCRSGRLYE